MISSFQFSALQISKSIALDSLYQIKQITCGRCIATILEGICFQIKF